MIHYDDEILKLLEARGPMKTPEIATAIRVPILRANKIMHSLERYKLVKSEHTPNHPPFYGVIIWRLARCSLIR